MITKNPLFSEALWKSIPGFSNYEISTLGEVFNIREQRLMRTSRTPWGHVKITMVSDWDNCRYTRSVAQMVAEAFVRPPNVFCDRVVVLDGNLGNVASENLVWRPRWFAWKYAHQVRVPQPTHFLNLSVLEITQKLEFQSVIEAGMTLGLLFTDIWRSTYTGYEVFPGGFIFEIAERV